MYKILHFDGLGVGGRQNELIELALTHRFNAIEIDMADLIGRHDTMGQDFACQFIQSAKIKIGGEELTINMGTFTLPVDLGCNDDDFAKFMAKTDTIATLAKELGCKVCVASISPASDDYSFQENFERHRTRLYDLGERFAESGLRIGLALNASKAKTAKGSHKFVQSAEEILTLVKTVGHANVGLCLDTFEWQVGSGAMDQLSEVDVNTFTEVRLGDVADSADPGNIKPSDRVTPGDAASTLARKLMDHLQANNYDGAISVGTNQAMFAGSNRDKLVALFSTRIDRLIANEPLEDPEVPEEVSGEADAAPEGEKEKGKEQVAAS